MDLSNRPNITFDADGKVRVLEDDKFKATEELEKEARAFIAKIQAFSGSVHGIVDGLSKQAVHIENAKLKAVGQRLLFEAEKEGRDKRAAELRSRIDNRNAELRRLTLELDSLNKLEAEQKEILDKLSENEPLGI